MNRGPSKPRAMPGMFEQVEEWWANSTDLLVCCRTDPTGLRRMNPSEQHQGEVFTAGLINEAADVSTPRRCPSAPDQRAHSIALRQRQRKLVERLCGVHENFVDVFAVPSSHPAPPSFLAGHISHRSPRHIHVGALCSLYTEWLIGVT
jgi:hypothetical protein